MSIPVPAQYPSTFPCRIAFVGTAPLDDEMEHGIPFVGPSGRLLNSMLRTANLERSEFLITNVFDTQLEDRDASFKRED